jgi:hypothetical protein
MMKTWCSKLEARAMANELPEERPNLLELSRRLARTLGLHDCEPSERFCDLLGRLPELGQESARRTCGDALGWEPDPEDKFRASDPAEMFRAPTLEELRQRLRKLVQREKLFEPMLLPGLYMYLIGNFRVLSQQEATSDAIDRDLEQLQKLEAWKQLPLKDRPSGFTDDKIDRVIPLVQAKAGERAEERKVAGQMLELLESEWIKTFTPEYWRGWLKRMAEES